MKNRESSIDISKTLAIILVIYAHVASDDMLPKVYVFSFAMSLFFFLSGLFLKYRPDMTWADTRSVLVKRFWSLIVPYFIWACLYTTLSWKHFYYILYGSWASLHKSGTSSALWFLVALFCAICIVQLVFLVFAKCHITRKAYFYLVTILLFAVGYAFPHPAAGIPWEFDVAIMAAGFLMLGYLCRDIVFRTAHLSGIKLSVLFLLFLVALIVAGTALLDPHRLVMFANADYGPISTFLLMSALGTVTFLLLAMLLDKMFHQGIIKDMLVYCGQITLPIFLLHKFWRELAYDIFSRLHWNYYTILSSVVVVLFVFMASALTYYIYDKTLRKK